MKETSTVGSGGGGGAKGGGAGGGVSGTLDGVDGGDDGESGSCETISMVWNLFKLSICSCTPTSRFSKALFSSC